MKMNDPHKIDDFIYDNEISNETTAVYFNPKTSKGVVIHRGTRGGLDWFNNYAYLKNVYKYTPRYRNGREAHRKADKKYGRENLDILSHSQGGILSRELGTKNQNIITLNPAKIFESKKDNETIIKSKGDVVSFLAKGDIEIPNETSNPITEHKVDILLRLPQEQMLGRGKTWKQKFNKKYGFDKNTSHSLEEISTHSGVTMGSVQEAFNRGVGASKTNPQSVRNKYTGRKRVGGFNASNRMTPEQWGFGRAYGLVMGNPKQVLKGNPDSDLV
jgi:hypothetical protein